MSAASKSTKTKYRSMADLSLLPNAIYPESKQECSTYSCLKCCAANWSREYLLDVPLTTWALPLSSVIMWSACTSFEYGDSWAINTSWWLMELLDWCTSDTDWW